MAVRPRQGGGCMGGGCGVQAFSCATLALYWCILAFVVCS